MGAKEIQIDWKDLGKPQTLPSGTTYKIVVKREPIPIIFVPGIMGSRLRGADKAIWDPDAKGFMLWNYGLFFDTPRAKMEMLVGPKRLFQPGFAFPDEDDAKHNKLFKEYPGADKRGW